MPAPAAPEAVEALRERVRGTVLDPGDDGYDDARTLWNARFDARPAVVVRARGAADVIAAVDLARNRDLPLSVKCGGHGMAGRAVREGAILVDLSAMDSVRVDPGARVVRVGGGATWDRVNHETLRFRLLAAGVPDSVGVGGFTLGGGMSYLSRVHGLTVDTLREVDVVTADGRLVTASPERNAELFWALRGGGGNFGVVTSFALDCFEVSPELATGRLVYPVEAAGDVLRFYREVAPEVPEEVFATVSFSMVPEVDEFPSELHGETVVAMSLIYVGDPERAGAAFEPFSGFGDPLLETFQTRAYTTLFDGLSLEAGRRNHWKSHFLAGLSDEAIEAVVDHGTPVPNQSSVVSVLRLGGAVGRVDTDATAFAHRDADYYVYAPAQWDETAHDDEMVAWVEAFHEALAPHATGGEYVNNQTASGPERARAAYGDNFDRLVEVKRRWDPEGLFDATQPVDAGEPED